MPCGTSTLDRPVGTLVLAVDITQEELQRSLTGRNLRGDTLTATVISASVAIRHLKMKIGNEAVSEFRTRLAEVQRATEGIFRHAEAEIVTGRRKSGERVTVPLEPGQGR